MKPAAINGNVMPSTTDWGRIKAPASTHLDTVTVTGDCKAGKIWVSAASVAATKIG